MITRMPQWGARLLLSSLVGLLGLVVVACEPLGGAISSTTAPAPPQSETPLPTAMVPSSTPQGAPEATPDLNQILSETLRNLPEGRMAFNPPAEMRVGEWRRVALRIQPLAPAMAEQAAAATLVVDMPGEAEPLVESLRVGTIMRARLDGGNFEVSAHNSEEQIVAADAFTEWVWDVKALKSGEQKLDLVVTVRVLVEGWGERERDLPVVTKDVSVQVNPVYSLTTFVGKYWQWLATTLVIPLGGWIWKAYAAKRSGGKDQPEPGKKPVRKAKKP